MRLHLFIILHLFFFFSLTGQNMAVIDEGMYQIDTNLKMILTNHDPDRIQEEPSENEFTEIYLDALYKITEPVTHFVYGGKYKIIHTETEEEYTLYFTQLPIIHITSSDVLSKESRIRGHFFMSESDHTITDELIGVNYRGDWTYRNLPKKSLRIEFWEDVEGIENKNVSLLGMRSDDDWNIDAIFNEPLRINSIVGFQLWEAIGSLPHVHLEPEARHNVRLKHVEVFLNGSYHGVCVLSERIDQKQLQLKKFNGKKRGELYKGRENGDFANGFKVAPPYDNDSLDWSGFLMKYPKAEEVIDWEDLFEFVTFVMESDDQEFEDNIEKHFDLENAVNYLIFVNALRAPDNLQKNIYTARYDSGTPYFFTAWDLDGILGIRYNGTRMPEVHGLYTNELFRRLLRDCRPGGFVDRLHKRWKQLRQNVITHENFMSLIRENVENLQKNGVYEREFSTWQENDLYVYPDGDPNRYLKAELDYRDEWIKKRLDMMDDIIASYSRCAHLDEYEDAFITTWKISSQGKNEKNQIEIPASGDFIYHWENVKDSKIRGTGSGTGTTQIDFPQAGSYRIVITPDDRKENPFHRINFKDAPDKNKIIRVEQWGNIQWSTMKNAFHGAENLKLTATDQPDLSQMNDMSYAFFGTHMQSIPNLEKWDVSHITNMEYLFANTPHFNQSLIQWDVRNVKNMKGIFKNAASYNHSLETWSLDRLKGEITLSSSGLDCENYSYTLKGWSTNPNLSSDIILEAENLSYSTDPELINDRQMLIDQYQWIILQDTTGDCTGFQHPFITIWNTRFTGTTDSNQIEIPAEGQFIYEWIALDEELNAEEDSGHGIANGREKIAFPEPGIYKVILRPTGDLPLHRIEFDNGGDRKKLIRIEQWGNVGWSSFENAFYGAENFEITAEDIPDLSQVVDMSYSFASTSFENVPRMDEWDLSHVKFARGMFEANPAFNAPIGDWDVSQMISMQDMFRGASQFDQPIGDWDVGQVTTMKNMFRGAEQFNQPIGQWDVGNLVDAKGMFRDAIKFNQEIGNWDVSQVVDMDNMFRGASEFDQNLNNWDVSSVKIMNSMFRGATRFNQEIGGWNVENVIDMKSMFEEATSFNQSIGDWNVKNVMDMKNMFREADQFNQSLDKWNTSRVESMAGMFRKASAFNQPIQNWDVASVADMDKIFEDATSFDQNLGQWNLSGLTNGDFSFSNSGMSCRNYSLTLQGWAALGITRGLTLKAKGMNYSPNETIIDSRNHLISELKWNIKDDQEGVCTMCTEPGNIEITILDNTTAEIAWEADADEEWEIIYGPAGFDIYDYQNDSDVKYDVSSSNRYFIDQLTPDKDYDLYVRGECPADVLEDWSGPEFFAMSPTASDHPYFEGLKFYPNPVGSQLNLKASFEVDELVIFDLQGKAIRELQPNSSATIINTSALKSGIYYIRVQIRGKAEIHRFVKF